MYKAYNDIDGAVQNLQDFRECKIKICYTGQAAKQGIGREHSYTKELKQGIGSELRHTGTLQRSRACKQ